MLLNYEHAEQWVEAITVYEQLVTQAPDEESRERWKRALERCQKERRLVRGTM